MNVFWSMTDIAVTVFYYVSAISFAVWIVGSSYLWIRDRLSHSQHRQRFASSRPSRRIQHYERVPNGYWYLAIMVVVGSVITFNKANVSFLMGAAMITVQLLILWFVLPRAE